MEIHEIFKELSTHSLIGSMVHDSYSHYFNFLNLKGYKRMEEYRSKEELKNYRRIHRYYISHYNKLIPEEKFEAPKVIPDDWYKHSKNEVDTNTKRNAVKTAFTKWVEWEKGTKDLYQKMYKELVDLGEVDSSLKVGSMIKDVSAELERAESMLINLQSVDFAMDCILDVQQQLHDEFKTKE